MTDEEADEYELQVAQEIAAINNIAYRGYFYDSETGLYYLQSRYYDPEVGRFINADDTAFIGYDGTPISSNLFSYCCNDPLNYMDQSGYWKYNSKKAVDYARKYAKFPNFLNYHYFLNGDCANFVSQCLYAGGIQMTSDWYSKRKKRYGISFETSEAWSLVVYHQKYFANWDYISGIGFWSFSSKKSEILSNLKDLCAFAKSGCILYMDLTIDGKERYQHAVLVTEVHKSDLKYCAHTKSRKDQSLQEVLLSNTMEYICVMLIK